MSLSLPQMQAIALNRFGLGARPDEALPADPKAWLLAQFGRFEVKPAPYAALPPPGDIARAYLNQMNQLLRANGKQPPSPAGAMTGREMDALAASQPGNAGAGPAPIDQASIMTPGLRKDLQDALGLEQRQRYFSGADARMAIALTTQTPFVERVVNFWSNHFAISTEKPQAGVYSIAYETEAIRPHVLGRFEDMLLAVEHHPAMLAYLDQFTSAGPDSPYGVKAGAGRPDMRFGLNENLAREIMELHTLGVRTGYTQADVTEFARALTGWTLGGVGPMGKRDGVRQYEFMFRDAIHEPGDRRIMGKTYPAGGEAQGLAVLRDLAASPSTARHIATKLARHFVADDPPPSVVDRMTKAYLDGRGDLPAVYRVMVEAPETWAAAATKFKTPWDWTVSSLRGLGRRESPKTANYAAILSWLGQPVWRPGAPAGFDDSSASWAAPEALVTRLDVAQRFAAQAGGQVDARALVAKLLPGGVSSATATALAQADSGATAIALLLVSPEFQRR